MTDAAIDADPTRFCLVIPRQCGNEQPLLPPHVTGQVVRFSGNRRYLYGCRPYPVVLYTGGSQLKGKD